MQYNGAMNVFGNAGDRAGTTHIVSVEVTNPSTSWLDEDKIKASYYNYSIVRAYGTVSQDIALRNISQIDQDIIMDLHIKIEWRGTNLQSGNFERKGSIEHIIKLLVLPSMFENSQKKNN